MLQPGALQRRWWKKIPTWLWFQRRAVRHAHCIHAKSLTECADLRRFGLQNPIAVIPNPIRQPAHPAGVSAEPFRRAFGLPDDKSILLYLGRLHPVKGLPRLIQAWAALTDFHPVWRLVLAGPDEAGYRRGFELLAAQSGCGDSVVFTGQLDDTRKWQALAAAALFVMPSDFENFGNAILEALVAGLPVVTTTHTPWQDLALSGAGWWVPPSPAALTDALRQALALSPDERRSKGRKASQLAEPFQPQRALEALLQVYQWLLGASPRPSCVHLD